MRVVLDTNVFVSGLLGGRTTRRILEAWFENRLHLLITETLLEELSFVLSRPKWKRVIPPTDSYELLTSIREGATIVTPSQRIFICRDAADNAVLECAVAGNARYLVTGDKDLLVLNPFHKIRIVPPGTFLDELIV